MAVDASLLVAIMNMTLFEVRCVPKSDVSIRSDWINIYVARANKRG